MYSIKTNYAANTDMKKIFCIIPIGNIDNKILQYTQMELEERFNVAVDIGRQLEEPAYAYHKHKKQYNSTKILKKIHKLKLTGYDRILGIVDVDLYVPERTFVFGGADVKKKVSVISLTRLRHRSSTIYQRILRYLNTEQLLKPFTNLDIHMVFTTVKIISASCFYQTP